MRIVLAGFVVLSLFGCSRKEEAPDASHDATVNDAAANDVAVENDSTSSTQSQADETEIPVAADDASGEALSAAVNLVERKLLDGRIAILLPEDFELMGEEMLSLKYPSERRPTVVYTNEKGNVNVAANHTKNAMKPDKLNEFHAAMEQMMKNLYPSAKWHRSEVTTINERRFLVMEFETPAIDTKIRNVMWATSYQDRVLMFSCNATVQKVDAWLDTFSKIVESTRIVD